MADVRLFRLTTGEDIIGNIKEGDEESNTITLEKPYVIIPQQEAPCKPNSRISFIYSVLNVMKLFLKTKI